MPQTSCFIPVRICLVKFFFLGLTILKSGNGCHHKLTDVESLRGFLGHHVKDLFGRRGLISVTSIFIAMVQFGTDIVQSDSLVAVSLTFKLISECIQIEVLGNQEVYKVFNESIAAEIP